MSKISLTHANIIELLGVESLPLEKRHEIVESVAELVEARVRNRILESLDESKQSELNPILRTGDSEALGKFLVDNGINYLQLMEEETERVKQELLKVAE